MATVDRYSIQVDTAQAQRSISSLQTALVGLTAAFSVREIVGFADSITSVRNRLNQLSPTLQGVEAQFQGIAAIAIQARTPLEQTADLYFRIARAAQSLGISQQEAANITSSVAKALSASGMSAQEAAGPLLQLGQALQAGTFQGDELRSILEGLPPVARALADQLNVPIGALKKLGSEGKINGQIFVEAMRNAAGAIEQDFARTTPTIAQAFNGLKTQIGVAFSEFERNTNTGRNFALAIEYIGFTIFKLTKSIDEVTQYLAPFLKVVGGLVVFTVAGRAIGAFLNAIKGVAAAVASIPAAFAGLKKTLEVTIYQFKKVWEAGSITGKTFEALGKRVRFLGLDFSKLATGIGSLAAGVAAFLGLDKLGDWFKSLGEEGSTANDDLKAYREELAKLSQGFDTTAGAAEPAYVNLAKINTEIARGLGNYQRQTELQLRGIEAQKAAFAQTQGEIAAQQQLTEYRQRYLDTLFDLENQLKAIRATNLMSPEDTAKASALEAAIKQLNAAYAEGLPLLRASADELGGYLDAQERAGRIAELLQQTQDIQRDLARSTADMRSEFEELNMDPLEIQLRRIEREGLRRLEDQVINLKRQLATTNDPSVQAAILGQIQAIEASSEQTIRSQQQLATESYRYQRSFTFGWQKAWREYAREATNSAKLAENIFRKATQGMEDAIVNFAKTGKFEWKNFVAMMLEELLRAQIQQLFAQMLGNMQGSMRNFTGGMGGGGGGNLLGAIGGGLDLVGAIGGLLGSGSGRTNVAQNGAISGGQRGGGGIIDTIGSALGSLGSGASNIVSGIASGIGSAASYIGSGISSAVSGIGDFFSGFFANGGMIPQGRFGIVGERGPEFVGGPATVTPMMSGSVTYNINAVDARSFKELVAQDPQFIHAVVMQAQRSMPATRR